MTVAIVAYINDELAIRVHRFSGVVTPGQVYDLATFYDSARPLVRTDLISIVGADVQDTSALFLPELDQLRRRFRELHEASDFILLRRSGWVCQSRAAWSVLEAWLQDRHSRDGHGSELFLSANLAELDGLFDKDEISAVADFTSFRQVFAISE